MKCLFSILMLVLFFATRLSNAATTLATTDTIPADTLSKWITKGASFDFILIDVRDSGSTDMIVTTGVIGTTQCRPYNFSYNRGVFDRLIPQLPKQMHIILYCRSGGRSGICATKLDSAGFSYVYSLKGGFNGWTGSLDSISLVRPATDLPAPSMVTSAISNIEFRPIDNNRDELAVRDNRIFQTTLIRTNHTLKLFAMNGSCVFQWDCPFSFQHLLFIPSGISPGTYVARLEADGRRNHSCLINIDK